MVTKGNVLNTLYLVEKLMLALTVLCQTRR